MTQIHSQLMFGDSRPEGSDHYGENCHQKNDYKTAVEPLLLFPRIGSVYEKFTFRIFFYEFEQDVAVDRIEESRDRNFKIRFLRPLF